MGERTKGLSSSVLPKKIRYEVTDRILESLNEHEEFFLNYNDSHYVWTRERIRIFKEFCEMIKNDHTREKYFNQFIEETKKHDSLRKQSVLDVLPELTAYFS